MPSAAAPRPDPSERGCTVIRPSREEFVALARDHTVVPVWREVLADLETPVSAFVKLVGAVKTTRPASSSSRSSTPSGGEGSRSSAAIPCSRWSCAAIRSSSTAPRPRVCPRTGALAALEALLAAYRAPHLDELPPFHGGVVGYLGYDVVREIERLPDVPPDDLGTSRRGVVGHRARHRVRPLPPAPLPDRERVPRSGCRRHLAATRTTTRAARLALRVDELARPLPYVPSPPPASELDELPEFTSTMGSGTYHAAVEVAREHILAGDIFQVVLAQRFDLEGHFDPFDVYRVLRQVNPSPYMYFVRHPEATLVGSSPETAAPPQSPRCGETRTRTSRVNPAG